MKFIAQIFQFFAVFHVFRMILQFFFFIFILIYCIKQFDELIREFSNFISVFVCAVSVIDFLHGPDQIGLCVQCLIYIAFLAGDGG
ncbi:hypothetical protein CXU10_07725 [Akkermansia muciniphila]|nr:hypothetical protein CXU10_07725 [Akkermansia muciniphila]